MKKWFSYTFLGLLVLAIGLFAYHFYAANDAEQKLDESIQKITAEAGLGLTVGYSSIEVNPFSGDVVFSDLNIIRNEDIRRATAARLDLAYSDFVNITLWGTEYGLRHIEQGILEMKNLSFTNRSSLLEVKLDSLSAGYSGNLWNLIVLGITRSPARIRHRIDAAGSRFTFSQPESVIGTIKADSVRWTAHFGNLAEHPDSLTSNAALFGITWSPPRPFREKYRFFIQGFGYSSDAIPLDRAVARYQYFPDTDSLAIKDLSVYSDLFTLTVQGGVALDGQSFGKSRIKDFVVRLQKPSPRFQTFLDQLKKLTGLPLPENDDKMVLSIMGSVENPQISFSQ